MGQNQKTKFDNTVRDAEAAGAAVEPHAAVEHLRDAKSEFEYAQHLPRDPEHARQLLAKAQADAEMALTLARHHLDEDRDGRALARQEAKADEATTSAP